MQRAPYRQRVLRFRKEVGPGRSHGDVVPDWLLSQHLKGLLRSQRVGHGPPPVPGASLDAVTRPTLFPSVVTPIDLDRAGPEFVLDSSVRNKWLKELVESRLLGEDLQADDRMALDFLHQKILEPEIIGEAERLFWADMVSWMVGKPRREEDRRRTPWLSNVNISPHDRNLATFTPSIAAFLGVFIETRSRFMEQIEELKIRGPINLVEAYLYFKYIVRQDCKGFLDDVVLMDLRMDAGLARPAAEAGDDEYDSDYVPSSESDEDLPELPGATSESDEAISESDVEPQELVALQEEIRASQEERRLPASAVPAEIPGSEPVPPGSPVIHVEETPGRQEAAAPAAAAPAVMEEERVPAPAGQPSLEALGINIDERRVQDATANEVISKVDPSTVHHLIASKGGRRDLEDHMAAIADASHGSIELGKSAIAAMRGAPDEATRAELAEIAKMHADTAGNARAMHTALNNALIGAGKKKKIPWKRTSELMQQRQRRKPAAAQEERPEAAAADAPAEETTARHEAKREIVERYDPRDVPKLLKEHKGDAPLNAHIKYLKKLARKEKDKAKSIEEEMRRTVPARLKADLGARAARKKALAKDARAMAAALESAVVRHKTEIGEWGEVFAPRGASVEGYSSARAAVSAKSNPKEFLERAVSSKGAERDELERILDEAVPDPTGESLNLRESDIEVEARRRAILHELLRKYRAARTGRFEERGWHGGVLGALKSLWKSETEHMLKVAALDPGSDQAETVRTYLRSAANAHEDTTKIDDSYVRAFVEHATAPTRSQLRAAGIAEHAQDALRLTVGRAVEGAIAGTSPEIKGARRDMVALFTRFPEAWSGDAWTTKTARATLKGYRYQEVKDILKERGIDIYADAIRRLDAIVRGEPGHAGIRYRDLDPNVAHEWDKFVAALVHTYPHKFRVTRERPFNGLAETLFNGSDRAGGIPVDDEDAQPALEEVKDAVARAMELSKARITELTAVDWSMVGEAERFAREVGKAKDVDIGNPADIGDAHREFMEEGYAKDVVDTAIDAHVSMVKDLSGVLRDANVLKAIISGSYVKVYYTDGRVKKTEYAKGYEGIADIFEADIAPRSGELQAQYEKGRSARAERGKSGSGDRPAVELSEEQAPDIEERARVEAAEKYSEISNILRGLNDPRERRWAGFIPDDYAIYTDFVGTELLLTRYKDTGGYMYVTGNTDLKPIPAAAASPAQVRMHTASRTPRRLRTLAAVAAPEPPAPEPAAAAAAAVPVQEPPAAAAAAPAPQPQPQEGQPPQQEEGGEVNLSDAVAKAGEGSGTLEAFLDKFNASTEGKTVTGEGEWWDAVAGLINEKYTSGVEGRRWLRSALNRADKAGKERFAKFYAFVRRINGTADSTYVANFMDLVLLYGIVDAHNSKAGLAEYTAYAGTVGERAVAVVGAKANEARIATARALSDYFKGNVSKAENELQTAGGYAPATFKVQGLGIAKGAIYADLKSKRDPKKQAMPATDYIHEYGTLASRAWLALIDRLDKTYAGVRLEGEALEVAAARLWRDAKASKLGERRSDDEIAEMDFDLLARRESQRKTGRAAPQPEKQQKGWFGSIFG